VEHQSRDRLAAGLGHICDSPRDAGRLVLIVRRPAVGERDRPAEAVPDQVTGLDGDNWLDRGSRSTRDGSADPRKQVTVMNARVVVPGVVRIGDIAAKASGCPAPGASEAALRQFRRWSSRI
jgi:hypothetical protein